ncbi:MAG TPA: hypothetical protein DEP84_01160 [Chloroflexi bacterium]|nr:hypothetical protein [Chloroflexota bacterium]
MAVAFESVRIDFDSTAGRAQREPRSVTFHGYRRVTNADAAVKGFEARFTRGDRNVFQLQVDLDVVGIERNTVMIAGDLAFRDASGNFDDEYEGFIEALVIADVER